MNFEHKILNLMNNNGGYVTTKMLTENNINRFFLTKMEKDKKIEKVTRGLYMKPNCFTCEYYKVQCITKFCVFGLETALYLHELSDRIPILLNVSVPRNYNGILSKMNNVQLNYVSSDIHQTGVVTINSPFNMPIKVYDIEKTICDIIKYRAKIDTEIFTVALKRYVNSKNKKLNNLIEYAKKMKIENEVTEYLEILL